MQDDVKPIADTFVMAAATASMAKSHVDSVSRLSAGELASLSLTVSLAFSAFKEHMTKLAEAVAERCNHVDGLELVSSIDAHLSDACGDFAGALAMAADIERDTQPRCIS